jgi:hypothetical protein
MPAPTPRRPHALASIADPLTAPLEGEAAPAREMLRLAAPPLPLGFLALAIATVAFAPVQLSWIPLSEGHHRARGARPHCAVAVPGSSQGIPVARPWGRNRHGDPVRQLGRRLPGHPHLSTRRRQRRPRCTAAGLGGLPSRPPAAARNTLVPVPSIQRRASVLPLGRSGASKRAVDGRLPDQFENVGAEPGVRQQL